MKFSRTLIKWFALIMGLVISGCSQSVYNLGDPLISSTEEQEVTTITYWGWDKNWYEPMFAAFEASHPHINIEVTEIAYSDYFTQIQQAIAVGAKLPTIVQQSCSLIANYKALNIFEDLTQSPYNVDPEWFFEFIKTRALTGDNKLTGILQSISPSGIAYKRDLAKAYFGTDDPTELSLLFSSAEDYIRLGRQVQQQSNGSVYLFHSADAVAEWLYFADTTDVQTGNTINFTAKMTPILDLLIQMRDNKVIDNYENGTPQANATYAGDKHIF